MAGQALRVTVWNEFHAEQSREDVRRVYPEGIHAAIADALKRLRCDWRVRTSTLEDPECGLEQRLLDDTDVLVYWAHARHGDVTEEAVERVRRRVLDGMGLVLLHSALQSRVSQRLLGTSGAVRWREAGEKERVWVLAPGHPIAAGLEVAFVVPHVEMYGDPADIPPPHEIVFISWFEGGEVFRSGVTWLRGQGRIFYFRPGHEQYPIYRQPEVQQVLVNAVEWAVPPVRPPVVERGMQAPLEPLGSET